jgi:ACS family tartrate transporter-like MFS transporter
VPRRPVASPGHLDRALGMARRRLLPLLILTYVVAWLDRVNIGFAALQMNRDLGFSPAVYGFGAGLFFVSYGLLEIPSNLALVRFGTRRWLARIMISWGLLTVATLLVTTPRQFYVMRFLLGAAEAGCLPGIIFYLGNWFPASERGRVMALLMLAIPLAAIVGGPLAGVLLGFNGMLRLAGWQWLLLLEGLPAVLLGLLVLRFLPDTPETARWLDAPARAALLAALRRAPPPPGAHRQWSVVFGNVLVWQLAAAQLLGNIGSFGLQFWLPQILKSVSGASDLLVGMAAALPFVPAAVVMVLVGRHSDRTGERAWHAALACLVAAAGFALAASVHSTAWSLLAMTVAACGIYGRHGPAWAVPSSLLAGRAAAAGIALINSVGAVGGFVGPYAVGLFKGSSSGYAAPFVFLGAALALSAVLFATLPLARAAAAD